MLRDVAARVVEARAPRIAGPTQRVRARMRAGAGLASLGNARASREPLVQTSAYLPVRAVVVHQGERRTELPGLGHRKGSRERRGRRDARRDTARKLGVAGSVVAREVQIQRFAPGRRAHVRGTRGAHRGVFRGRLRQRRPGRGTRRHRGRGRGAPPRMPRAGRKRFSSLGWFPRKRPGDANRSAPRVSESVGPRLFVRTTTP